MTLEEIIQILTPILSAVAGVIGALIVLLQTIRGITNMTKQNLTENQAINQELKETKEELADLRLKTAFLVEDVKSRTNNAKSKQKQG